MALAADRDTPERAGVDYEYPMAASAECFAGALIVLDSSGNAEPGTTATGKLAAGRCEEYAIEATAVAAASNVKVKAGIFRWANSSGDPVTKANIGDTVYVEDDETVCATATGKSAAGVMTDIDSLGVWVETKPPVTLVSGFAVANNLSEGTASTMRTNLGLDTMAVQAASAVTITGGDISGITDLPVADGGTGASTAAAARAALGSNKVLVNLRATDVLAANTEVYRVIAPVAGDIVKIWTITEGDATATGDITLTCSIGGVAITDGVVTIAHPASEGTIDSATPSAAKTVAAGDEIRVTVGGSNTEAGMWVDMSFEIDT